jgi:DNA topoisomerase VI subunit B
MSNGWRPSPTPSGLDTRQGSTSNERAFPVPPRLQDTRLAEFCSQKELVNQTGHAVEDWPLVDLKELIDNALDGAEESGIAPIIEISVSQDDIAVADNGPGIAPETVADIIDYTARVSSREAYVSPTRGAQGNALKTILAMPFALDGERGETIIESQGVAHRIGFSIDRIRQEPRISRVCETSPVKAGTRITVQWPDSASSILDDAKARFLQVAEDYTWVNPHLTLTVNWDRSGETIACASQTIRRTIAATNPAWKKWRPSDPSSPHWYDVPRFGRLIAAHIAHAEDHEQACPTVREFVSEFRGLSGTAKGRQICDTAGASRLSLAEFYGDGTGARIDALLSEMSKRSCSIKPKNLGAIGNHHLAAKFRGLGVAHETFNYRRAEFEHASLPYLAEVAFGYCPNGPNARRIITGLNWSVAIGADPFRNLGPYGESLDSILTNQRAGRREPIVMVLHLACPRIEYLDRGKSSVIIPGSLAVDPEDWA